MSVDCRERVNRGGAEEKERTFAMVIKYNMAIIHLDFYISLILSCFYPIPRSTLKRNSRERVLLITPGSSL